jgi:hypothetical protein
MEGRPERRMRDLGSLCEAADRILELVRTRLPQTEGPVVRDWNDRIFLLAFTRAYRCLRSIRELACRGEAEDSAVLTRALVSLTLQYLWLVRTEDEDERRDRLRRLLRKWATEYAVMGAELLDLGYLPSDGGEDDVRESIEKYRETAEAIEREGIGRVPDERSLAIRLDRDLQPTEPRFFELLYARIYRPTSHVGHYGLGAAVRGLQDQELADDPGALTLERVDEEGAAESLGLALAVFGALLDFSEPVVHHGIAAEVAEVINQAHDPPE